MKTILPLSSCTFSTYKISIKHQHSMSNHSLTQWLASIFFLFYNLSHSANRPIIASQYISLFLLRARAIITIIVIPSHISSLSLPHIGVFTSMIERNFLKFEWISRKKKLSHTLLLSDQFNIKIFIIGNNWYFIKRRPHRKTQKRREKRGKIHLKP